MRKNNLYRFFGLHGYLIVSFLSLTGLVCGLTLKIKQNSTDVLIKERSLNKLKKINTESLLGMGGAYKPDVLDAPVSYYNYQIKAGESIYSISRKFGIDDVTIVNINDIKYASLIRSGVTIKLANQDGLVVKVKNESDLEETAKKYQMDKEEILRINNTTSDAITSDTSLFLPGVKVNELTRQLMLGEFFTSPAYGRITSYFGYRRDPWTGRSSFHQGLDIANRNGGYIYASAPGRVISTAYSYVYGNTVKIRHTSGYVTFYAHLSNTIATNGQWVNTGTKIGVMGSTGRSTGTHVHFEVRQYGRVINPMRVTLFR